MKTVDVSVIIPTKNGIETINALLKAIMQQDTRYEFEVIIIDSGSKDGTIEVIKSYPVRLYQIPPQEFGHGKTRNYGASLAQGEFIVFLTQDAIPVTRTWLDKLVQACSLTEDIVGVFGIHYPYPDCNPIDARNIKYHFDGFGDKVLIQYIQDHKRYQNEEGYRHWLGFFSDNNSCIRKSIWSKYPYPDVNFAEDQIWARSMIEMGYKKAYTPYAPVYHSHNYSLKTYLKRYYDEYKGLYDVYGYQIVKTWLLIVPGIVKSFYSDYKYLATCSFTKEEKRYWVYYSFVRNVFKYCGGYLGGISHKLPSKVQSVLKKVLSLEHQHRNA